ncbi:hypothetical protein [Mycolicibacterium sp. S3B2]|uniref:hypothetical protein n=1 Tax=Mycolicibacterium sp. S3B2 TaxID=3415120 RepID=UPI003C7B9F98
MPGDGARFQQDMPVTLCPPNVQPNHDNSEISYVTAVSGDVLTINRAQEGTTAMQVAGGWQVLGSLTAKTITDLEEAIVEYRDKHYVQQFVNSASVTVTHNLGKRLSVSVVDSSGELVEGDVHYDSDNQLTLNFFASFSGVVYLN